MDSTLSDEQKKVVEDVFNWKEKAEYTDEEIEMLRDMFPTPDKIALLRKVLRAFNNEEYGFLYPLPINNIQGDDFEELGRNLTIQRQVDERVRGALATLYILLKNKNKEIVTGELEEKNRKDKIEQDRTDAFKEKAEAEKRGFGKNL